MSRIPEYKYRRPELSDEQRKAIFRKLQMKTYLYTGIAVLLVALSVVVVFAKSWRTRTAVDKIRRTVDQSQVSPSPSSAPIHP